MSAAFVFNVLNNLFMGTASCKRIVIKAQSFYVHLKAASFVFDAFRTVLSELWLKYRYFIGHVGLCATDIEVIVYVFSWLHSTMSSVAYVYALVQNLNKLDLR